jgi:DNA polymerase III delta prime subunit
MIFSLENKGITESVDLQGLLSEFKDLIRGRLSSYFRNDSNVPTVRTSFSKCIEFLNDRGDLVRLDTEEQVIHLLALVPLIRTNFFDSIIQEVLPQGGDFPEFGGVKTGNHRGMIPTGETAQFILAGNDIEKRIEVQRFFSREHFFHKLGILQLEKLKDGEPAMSGRIILSPEWAEYFLTGKMPAVAFSEEFPASLLTTSMEWSDLVLNSYTADLLEDIRHWLDHHKKLYADENLSPKIKPGFRSLFYGPSGTGKTLTASLLGKEFNKPVYRIDLSMVVSKFIGETEKNLSKVFDKAMNKDWILFFDEADALFSKRTGVQSSHDRYANQEVSYLLQRIEDFSGLLILASNLKSNIDEAFLRRFNTVVYFPKPDARERLRIWRNCIPKQLSMSSDVQIEQLSGKYELTGAMIVNVMQYAAVKAFASGINEVSSKYILDGIRKELQKEEKSMY